MLDLEDVKLGDLEKLAILPVFASTSEVALVSSTSVFEDIVAPVLSTLLFVELQETSL